MNYIQEKVKEILKEDLEPRYYISLNETDKEFRFNFKNQDKSFKEFVINYVYYEISIYIMEYLIPEVVSRNNQNILKNCEGYILNIIERGRSNAQWDKEKSIKYRNMCFAIKERLLKEEKEAIDKQIRNFLIKYQEKIFNKCVDKNINVRYTFLNEYAEQAMKVNNIEDIEFEQVYNNTYNTIFCYNTPDSDVSEYLNEIFKKHLVNSSLFLEGYALNIAIQLYYKDSNLTKKMHEYILKDMIFEMSNSLAGSIYDSELIIGFGALTSYVIDQYANIMYIDFKS